MILRPFEHGPDLKFGILSKILKMIGFWKLITKKIIIFFENFLNTFFLHSNLNKTSRRFLYISFRSDDVPIFVESVIRFSHFCLISLNRVPGGVAPALKIKKLQQAFYLSMQTSCAV